MGLARQALGLYARIGRIYLSWVRTLMPLAFFVFVPLGLIHALPVHYHLTNLDAEGSIATAASLGAVLFLTATGLVGEVFYTGAVAIALTHPHGESAPPLREVIRRIKYGRLIAVDILYGALVAFGVAAFVIPGLLAYIYLGLAAPIIEIEHRTVRSAFARSWRLVRGHSWLVLVVLVPIEVVGDVLTSVLTDLCRAGFGDSLVAEWLVDTASNIVLTPFYAVAAVLLTLDLIKDREGSAPPLHSQPARS